MKVRPKRKMLTFDPADVFSAVESFAYAFLGCVTGRAFGIPLNKVMFRFLIAEKWGTNWSVPAGFLLLTVLHIKVYWNEV